MRWQLHKISPIIAHSRIKSRTIPHRPGPPRSGSGRSAGTATESIRSRSRYRPGASGSRPPDPTAPGDRPSRQSRTSLLQDVERSGPSTLGPDRLQRLWRLPDAFRIEALRQRQVQCAGDMAGDSVDGFAQTCESLGVARIHEPQFADSIQVRGNFRGRQDPAVARRRSRTCPAARPWTSSPATPPHAMRPGRRSADRRRRGRASAGTTRRVPQTRRCPRRRRRPAVHATRRDARTYRPVAAARGSGCRPEPDDTGAARS